VLLKFALFKERVFSSQIKTATITCEPKKNTERITLVATEVINSIAPIFSVGFLLLYPSKAFNKKMPITSRVVDGAHKRLTHPNKKKKPIPLALFFHAVSWF